MAKTDVDDSQPDGGVNPLATIEGETRWAGVNHRELKSRDIVERNADVVAMRMRRSDLSWDQVGLRFGLSGRQCRTIYREWADVNRPMLLSEDPVEVFHEHLAGLQDLRGQAGRLAEQSSTPHAVVLGCLKVALQLRLEEIALRRETRLLPDFGAIRDELDTRFIAETVVDFAKRNKVPESEIESLVAVLTGEVTAEQITAAADADDDFIGEDTDDDD